MSVSPAAPTDEELAAALDEALTARQAGRPFDYATLLARYPQLAGALSVLGVLAGDAPSTLTGRPASGDRPLPEQVGPYRVERELGAGGFGVVYLARDAQLQRRVALKVLQTGR